MPRGQDHPEIAGAEQLLAAVRGGTETLKEKFKGHPIELAATFGMKFPKKPAQVMIELGVITPDEAQEHYGISYPGLRELVEDVCLGAVQDAAAVANRGGGKSMGVSFIEFYLVFILDYDALNLGGSELQADNVYQYLLNYLGMNEFWSTLVKGETQREKTFTIEKAWIRVLAASQKSVRSPHAGGVKIVKGVVVERGGVLVIDEEAEAAPDIVNASLSTVNTARPSVVLRCSTFHNAEGTFAELIDNHKEMGFTLYKWDIFDVAEPCDCTGGPFDCQSEEQCFREDHFEEYIDPDSGELTKKLLHRAYCGGRAKYSDGWFQMTEILKLFRRMRRNHGQWEVEAMGSRPATSGHVIKDLQAYANNIVNSSPRELYVPGGGAVTICVDWGAAAAGVSVWQELWPEMHVRLHSDLVMEAGQTQIMGVILGYATLYSRDLLEIAADIGGGGNYMNPYLREQAFLQVRDVNFGEEKEAAAAAWNILNEAGKARYLQEQDDAHRQVRSWKRKNGRIQKGNDHLCDADLCYFAKFIDQFGLTHVRIQPRTFGSQATTPMHTLVNSPEQGEPVGRTRQPMIARLGTGRSRRR